MWAGKAVRKPSAAELCKAVGLQTAESGQALWWSTVLGKAEMHAAVLLFDPLPQPYSRTVLPVKCPGIA